MTDKLTLTHHDAYSARPIVDQLVAVYLEAHAGDGPFYSEDRYRRQLQILKGQVHPLWVGVSA